MAKVTLTGTGSTRRAKRSLSAIDPADRDALLTGLKAMADAGDPFLGKLDGIEAACRAILDRASLPYDVLALLEGPPKGDEDSPKGYALQALNRLRLLRQAMQSGDARLAADLAFDLGALLAEAAMKPMADRAHWSANGRRKAARKQGAERHSRNSEINQAYQEAIDRGLPRKAVIADLVQRFAISERQLRMIIPPAYRK